MTADIRPSNAGVVAVLDRFYTSGAETGEKANLSLLPNEIA